MIVPAHPVDRVVLAGPDIECNNKPDLLFSGISNWWRPGGLLSEYVVDCLLVREQDVTVKSLFARGKVIGAEALVARAARDGERAVQHSGRMLVQDQLADLRVIEVILAVRCCGRGRDCTGMAPCWSRGSQRDRRSPLTPVRREIPSGTASYRKPLGSTSPTVSIGVTCTPRHNRGEHRGLRGHETTIVRACSDACEMKVQAQAPIGKILFSWIDLLNYNLDWISHDVQHWQMRSHFSSSAAKISLATSFHN